MIAKYDEQIARYEYRLQRWQVAVRLVERLSRARGAGDLYIFQLDENLPVPQRALEYWSGCAAQAVQIVMPPKETDEFHRATYATGELWASVRTQREWVAKHNRLLSQYVENVIEAHMSANP